MEVLAELGERVFGRFALEIAQLVHATPLHRGLGPRAPAAGPYRWACRARHVVG
jgi:hypothetical protein